ncbi:MAG: PD40 domain-containing protein [Flavobacteriales bacterium]|nr:PD40 domain-containing protein [Flavobacteriales bacterium]
MKRLSVICFTLMLFSSGTAWSQFYQGTQQEFGKNRVQYRDFNWLYYPYENFEVYFYQGGKDLAAYTVEAATKHQEELEALFDYKLDAKIEIVVYNKMSEFRQSNVGITGDTESNIGGSTRIVGSKVFLYFTGDYISYNQQIRAGLAEVLVSQLMYGGDWKQVIKNNTLLQLPDWYLKGLIEYAEGGFDAEREAYMQDGVMSGTFQRFNWLEGKDATYAGYALWRYIADVFGENVIPNILYMTKVSRNVESGFLYILGVSLSSLMDDFNAYYYRTYSSDQLTKKMPEWEPETVKPNTAERSSRKWRKKLGELPVKSKDKWDYSEFKLSPDQENVAYTTNEMGQIMVWLYNLNTGKKKRIFKHGYPLQRLNDESYPVLAWHPSGLILTFVYEKKGRAFIVNYNLEDKKVVEKELFRIDKVISMDYAQDGRRIAFSGVKQGQSDIYIYQTIGNNQTQITNDIYDDLEPQFIHNSEKIIFSSNRPDDTLRTDDFNSVFELNKDIFILDVENRSNILERVTNTPDVDESKPFQYDDQRYTYLAAREKKLNRYIAKLDSAISRIDTTIHYRYFTVSNQVSDFERVPLEYDFNERTGEFSMVFYENEIYTWYRENSKSDISLAIAPTSGNDSEPVEQGVDVLTIEPEKLKEGQIDIDNYTFEEDGLDYEFEKETISLDTFDSSSSADSLAADSAEKEFILPKPRNYRLNFATDYVLSQVDNQFNSLFYQRNFGPTSTFPGISGFLQLGVSDLFEDYKIVGGIRLSVSLDNSDIALSYEDLSKRVDRKFILQRQGNRLISEDGFGINEVQTYSAEYQYKYPFTELASFRLSATYRLDRNVTLATDILNLAVPNRLDHNVGLKAQYVYDNTISRGLNLFNGTRYKVWGEYLRNPFGNEESMWVIGGDFRHYERLHRDLILAVRFAGHTSFGDRQVITYLGGVDNWLFQRIDEASEIPQDEKFFFQALGSPLRGFFVNARNGNSFAVTNAEIRWPVFKYFMRKPIRSDFIQNFQVVGFGDVGSAWTGPHPYSDENLFNNQVIERNPITVTIANNREPIVWGYGFGLRSRLLGYFVRADWAWGVDDGMVLPRVFHLSLSMDF